MDQYFYGEVHPQDELNKDIGFLWKGGSKQTKYGISPDQGSIFHGDHGLYP